MKLLHVDTSILGDGSVSRRLTREIVSQWRRRLPGTDVEYLDLAVAAPAHFGPDALGIKFGIQDAPTEAQRRENDVSERLVSQFLAADVVVIGAPLYNFTIPTQLKAWIDRLAQAGRTFKYTDKGAVGLAGDKTVIVASSRGGVYSASAESEAMAHQESYLRIIFGFFGITDVRIVRAEGTAMGDAARRAGIESALRAIPAVVAAEERIAA
ncbi:MAG: FMN-dependent NADH-azoreductase [Burkholderiaceae bacterium]|nr:FMN-dependent NADH-azoreductase [Burkholderiaceae bacterium]